MVDNNFASSSLPFSHLGNMLHQLGHELHSELTEDIGRRRNARRFEAKLEIPINRAKMEKALIGATTFPYFLKLAPECGDCTLKTMKKPIARQEQQEHQQSHHRLHGPPPPSRRPPAVQVVEQKTSSISVTSVQKWQNSKGHQQQPLHHRRRRQEHRPKNILLRKAQQQPPKMCDSSTQTDFQHDDNDERRMMDGKVIINDNIDSKRSGSDSEEIDESFTVSEIVIDSMLGKMERKMDGKRKWKHRKSVPPPPVIMMPTKKKDDDVRSEKSVTTPKDKPKRKAEILKEVTKPHHQKCSIPAAEEAIPKLPNDQQLYAPIELHCATESAVKAVDRTVGALEKLILLAPKNAIEKSLLKTITLMCVFLRQFHTELRTTKSDRRSKLEIILRLWTELQKLQQQQQHDQKQAKFSDIHHHPQQHLSSSATNVPNYKNDVAAIGGPSSALLPPQPPHFISTDDITVKMDVISSSNSTIHATPPTTASSCFGIKKRKMK